MTARGGAVRLRRSAQASRGRALLALAALLLVACGGSEDGADGSGAAVDSVAGVPRTLWPTSGGESGVDVFDTDGQLLGRAVRVPWPHAFVTPRIVARVVRGELDVPRVQLLRLRPAGD